MWGNVKRPKAVAYDTLVGQRTELHGDVRFSGGLHIDGTVKGNIVAEEGASSLLTLSEKGSVEGEVQVPNAVINGTVIGDVHVRDQLRLSGNARISGDVYYGLIEMALGAEVNGKLVHRPPDDTPLLALERETEEQPAADNS
jgi:cytoskeletal protein CcmA (bactofilin family)